jgi:hypothetical protein
MVLENNGKDIGCGDNILDHVFWLDEKPVFGAQAELEVFLSDCGG